MPRHAWTPAVHEIQQHAAARAQARRPEAETRATHVSSPPLRPNIGERQLARHEFPRPLPGTREALIAAGVIRPNAVALDAFGQCDAASLDAWARERGLPPDD